MNNSIRVDYKIIEKTAEIRRLELGAARQLEIAFDSNVQGFLTIEKTVFPVEDGRVIINTKHIKRGTFHPILTTGGKQINLEPLTFDGYSITTPISEKDAILDIRLKLDRLCDEMNKIERRVLRAENKIDSTTIF